MTLPTISGEFYVSDEPAFRYTPGGLAVLRLRVKATYRKKDDSAPGGYRDDKVLWANANVWREKAEHAFASIKKGDLVVITGNIYINEYDAKDGSGKRQSTEIDVENIGPSLRFRETPHSGEAGNSSSNGGNQQATQQDQQAVPATSGGDGGEFPF